MTYNKNWREYQTYCQFVEFQGMNSAIMKFHDGDAIVYRRKYRTIKVVGLKTRDTALTFKVVKVAAFVLLAQSRRHKQD